MCFTTGPIVLKAVAEAAAFHEHCKDRESPEEDPSDEVSFEEDISDAGQQQQQLPDVPKTPPKSQAPAMQPPPQVGCETGN